MFMNQAELSSYVTTIVTVLLAYVGGSTISQNDLVGLVTAVCGLVMVLWNEAHNSSFVSGSVGSSSDDGEVVPDYEGADVEEPLDE